MFTTEARRKTPSTARSKMYIITGQSGWKSKLPDKP